MSADFGSDFIVITAQDGTEFEVEVLASVDYNGSSYLAVIPADADPNGSADYQVSILKSTEEDGESVLCAIEDEEELEAVNNLIMDLLYDEEN